MARLGLVRTPDTKHIHILYVIGTKIFQIDLLEAEKIESKDGNPT